MPDKGDTRGCPRLASAQNAAALHDGDRSMMRRLKEENDGLRQLAWINEQDALRMELARDELIAELMATRDTLAEAILQMGGTLTLPPRIGHRVWVMTGPEGTLDGARRYRVFLVDANGGKGNDDADDGDHSRR